ncbi:hypothetical protein [Micromonospora oryzae]|uniref:hypothetical protein n=1 Tax=Micromonospora sp. DSM 102119 TaxID=3111768 RepID=UPI0031D68072
MTTLVVTLAMLVVLLLAVVVFVTRRDRAKLSSDQDSAAVRQARADQHRHEAERHFASGMAARHHNPSST